MAQWTASELNTASELTKTRGIGPDKNESCWIYTSWVILMAAPIPRGVASCPILPKPPFASCSVRIVDRLMTVAARTAEVVEFPISRLSRYRQLLTPTSHGRLRAIGSRRAGCTCTDPAPRRRVSAPGSADQLTGGRRGGRAVVSRRDSRRPKGDGNADRNP